MEAIKVSNLIKHYGKVRAVNGASFNVREGEVFGLLGPNGAGKTTTVEILEGLRKKDDGEAEVFGMDVQKDQEKIEHEVGVVLQYTGMLPHLTLKELFELFKGFYKNNHTANQLVEWLELGPVLDRYYSDLSGGQKQRFVLALSLLHDPKLLFMDEPTIGLDPAVRQKFWDIIFELKKRGMTILLTTHYMEEAQILCDRVGIIDQGKVLVAEKPAKLVNGAGVISKIKFTSSKPINVADLEELPGVTNARKDRYTYDLETETPEDSLRYLLEWERQFSGKIFNLQVKQATLEDVFIKLTGKVLRD